ncbi:LCCL domain protein [Chondrocystis sp. NIES-4102]|nr:LCCL domain protein [Chondrocystis sp. NIES-4102]
MKNTYNFHLLFTTIAIAVGIIPANPVFAQDTLNTVPEIGWNSRIGAMGLDKSENGKQYTFNCQPAGDKMIHPPIWGTNIYTVNSAICTTAVHAGFITPSQGGKITIKLLAGQEFYTGSNKNNIYSQDHRNTEMSFTFVDESQVLESDSDSSSSFGEIVVNSLQKGVERSIERAIIDIFK